MSRGFVGQIQIARERRPLESSTRATGITASLEAGGELEDAQRVAGHTDPGTTKPYDRSRDPLTLDEIERIAI